MREIEYKSFSLNTRNNYLRLNKPGLCQFELTFGCAFHCGYCFTDCYNNRRFLRNELSTEEVKFILDKVYRAGILWLCFTGGDPLVREDFLEIYSYAKGKGFIIIVFTNGSRIDDETIKYFTKLAPFAIEMTLNALDEQLFEDISGVRGSFRRVMKAVSTIVKNKLPLKIKMQVTKDNSGEFLKVKRFAKRLGVKFTPDFTLYPRLNLDKSPCDLRLDPEEIVNLCRAQTKQSKNRKCPANSVPGKAGGGLFACTVAAGDGFSIDPYGNIFQCYLIRNRAFNLLDCDLAYAHSSSLNDFRDRVFLTNSRCGNCRLRGVCGWCPGKAHLENCDIESPIEYYCRLAKLTAGAGK